MTAGERFGAEHTTQEESGPATGAGPASGGGGGAGSSEDTATDRIAALDELAARPLAEHADGYERLHAELRAALAEIDDA